jgi:predicted MFS family arabinose efflux permease
MSTAENVSSQLTPPLWAPLRYKDYRLLWSGESVSVLGTQFNLVALPWLVLQMSGSGLTLGAVMMAAAIPRALLMLVGGTISDRVSPRLAMLCSNLARAGIVAGLAILIWSHTVRIELVLLLVFCIGVADAFFYPAYMAMVPRLVEPEYFAPANSLLVTSSQVMVLIGPAVAGTLIATAGLAPAFGIDSASFVVAAAALVWINSQRTPAIAASAARPGILSSTREGVQYAWSDGLIYGIILITAMVNLAFTGPYAVGTALLAAKMFRSATSLGIMLSAGGAGAILGSVAGGLWRPSSRRGMFILTFPFVVGFALIGMAFVGHVVWAAAIQAVIGVMNGFMNVFVTSMLQARVEPSMMGRVMGIITLAMFGLLPFSFLVGGLLSKLGVTVLFLTSGGLLLVTGILSGAIRQLRNFD